jgi:hypothetical protein
MNWRRFYRAIERRPDLLRRPTIVQLLEERLRQIETAQDRLEEEALRCDNLLDRADQISEADRPSP